MSFAALKWAWRAPVERPLERLVLLNLADRANPENECWPSQQRIAADTCMSERSVRAILVKLEDAGLIVRRHRGRPGRPLSDLVTLKLTALPASGAAGHRNELPEATGRTCRQTSQQTTQDEQKNDPDFETTQDGQKEDPDVVPPVWFERVPWGQEAVRRNEAVHIAQEIARMLPNADWASPALSSLGRLIKWLGEFAAADVRAILTQVASRAAASKATVHSWRYFEPGIEALRRRTGGSS